MKIPPPILMKLEFSQQIFEKKNSNIKFHENPPVRKPSCSTQTDRWTETTKLFFALRNFYELAQKCRISVWWSE